MSIILATQIIATAERIRREFHLFEINNNDTIHTTINSIYNLCTNVSYNTVGCAVSELHNTGNCKQFYSPNALYSFRIKNKDNTDWIFKSVTLQNVTNKPIRLLQIVCDEIFKQITLRNEMDKVLKVFVKNNKCVYIKTENRTYKVTKDEIKIDTEHDSTSNRVFPFTDYETFVGVNEFIRSEHAAKTLIVGATYEFKDEYVNENRDKINIDILNGTFILADSEGYTQLHNSKGEKLFNLLNQYDEERNNVALTSQEVLEFMNRTF